jgi:hypothetical protein
MSMSNMAFYLAQKKLWLLGAGLAILLLKQKSQSGQLFSKEEIDGNE